MKSSKHILILVFVTILYSILLLFFALFARNNFVDKTKPFPSWTYTHSKNLVNTLTSWDSGFYYDLAKTGYQNNTQKLPMASVPVPPDSWVKVFTGSGIVGKDNFALPFSKDDEQVNNVIIAYNGGTESVSLPIYYAYAGIPYCSYKGDIDYDRDVLPAAEALVNPNACGSSQCSASYVSYYDALAEKVVFQEVFTLRSKGSANVTQESSATPAVTVGSTRPVFNTEQAYVGSGCKSIDTGDISEQPLSSYKTAYSTFGFMPLYSLLAKGLAFVVQDVVLAGILISVLSFILCIMVFYKFVLEVTGDSNVSFWSAVAFMVLPASFFAITFQPVALFLLFFVLAAYFSWKSNWMLSALFFALLILTHILGVFALIPLFYLSGKSKKLVMASVLALLIVLIGQTAYLYTKTLDPLILLNGRIPWYGGAMTFVGSFVNYFLTVNIYVIFEVVLSLMFILIMLVSSRTEAIKRSLDASRLNPYAFAAMFALMALFNGGFAGMLKFMPVLLMPLAIYFGVVMSGKKPARMLLLLLVLLNVVLFCLWTVSSRFVI